MVASFIDFPKLLIAIVNGPAIGIAFTTLGLCDVVYASTAVSTVPPWYIRCLFSNYCFTNASTAFCGTEFDNSPITVRVLFQAFFMAPFTAHGLNAEGCSSYVFPRIMGDIKVCEQYQYHVLVQ
jgi:peroxisomal 3,2-trans-enoyl-CoA isomerase